MNGPLILSSSKEENKVVVNPKIVKTLDTCHVYGIRFLYKSCFIKGLNVVLNNEKGMNEQRQISALLSAVERNLPSLIICKENNLLNWFCELKDAGLDAVTANDFMKNESSDELPSCVLLTDKQVTHIGLLYITEWFLFVVQSTERLISSRYIKNVKSKHRIAITHENFLDTENLKTQYFIMKWINPSLSESKESFSRCSEINKKKLLLPYEDFWCRLTWSFFNKDPPKDLESSQEILQLSEKIRIFKSAKSNKKRSTKRKSFTKKNDESKKRRSDAENVQGNAENDHKQITNSRQFSKKYFSSSSSEDSLLESLKNAKINDSFTEHIENKEIGESEKKASKTLETKNKHAVEDKILDSLFDCSGSDNCNQNQCTITVDKSEPSCSLLDSLFDF